MFQKAQSMGGSQSSLNLPHQPPPPTWNALPGPFPPQPQQLSFHDPQRQAGQHILAALGVARPPPPLVGQPVPVPAHSQPLVRDLSEIWNIMESLGPIPNGTRVLDKPEFHARLMHLLQVVSFCQFLFSKS